MPCPGALLPLLLHLLAPFMPGKLNSFLKTHSNIPLSVMPWVRCLLLGSIQSTSAPASFSPPYTSSSHIRGMDFCWPWITWTLIICYNSDSTTNLGAKEILEMSFLFCSVAFNSESRALLGIRQVCSSTEHILQIIYYAPGTVNNSGDVAGKIYGQNCPHRAYIVATEPEGE